MSNLISFIFGTVFGAYITQNYKIPDVRNTLNIILTKIEDIEKNSRAESESDSKKDK